MKQILDLIMIAITPGIAIAILFYFHNRYDKKSIYLLVRLFIYGMIISVPVIFFERVLLSFDFFSPFISKLYQAVIVAGFTEEFTKRYVILSLAFKKNNFIDKHIGINYSVMTALGFATLENILYVFFHYQSYQIDFSRAIISVPGHILFAITMGFYLLFAKYSTTKKQQSKFFILSLIIPVLLHGLFDFIIYVQAFIILPLFSLFLVFLYIYNFKKLQRFYQ